MKCSAAEAETILVEEQHNLIMIQKEHCMKSKQFLILVTFVVLVSACTIKPPNELINARWAYKNASEGPAAQLVPAEVHKAHTALEAAEQSFKKDPGSFKTKDLAYVAQRKSELAIALGAMASDKANKDEANADFQKKQTELLKQGKQDLSNSQMQTAELIVAISANDADKEKELRESEERTAAALAELAKLAAVKEETRGLVITLSGSVLFRSTE